MPDAVLAILMALINLGDAGTRYQIIAESGYDSHNYIMPRLLERNWILQPFVGLWIITERGKIAVAIEVGRRTKARFNGVDPVRPGVDSFKAESCRYETRKRCRVAG